MHGAKVLHTFSTLIELRVLGDVWTVFLPQEAGTSVRAAT